MAPDFPGERKEKEKLAGEAVEGTDSVPEMLFHCQSAGGSVKVET